MPIYAHPRVAARYPQIFKKPKPPMERIGDLYRQIKSPFARWCHSLSFSIPDLAIDDPDSILDRDDTPPARFSPVNLEPSPHPVTSGLKIEYTIASIQAQTRALGQRNHVTVVPPRSGKYLKGGSLKPIDE